MCHTDLSQMNNLQTFDREAWIRKIAQCHWSFADLRSGIAWQWMKKYLK